MSQPYALSDPEQVNAFHALSDVDAGPLSQHHSLGRGNTQATAGDHVHDGATSARLGLAEAIPLPPATRGDLIIVDANGALAYVRLPRGNDGDLAIVDGTAAPGLRYVPAGGMLAPVRAARDTNLSVTAPGSPTADGVALASGDRVLLIAQTTGAENGVWTYRGNGNAMIRAADASLAFPLPGATCVACSEGTAYADTLWKLTTNGAVAAGTTQVWGLQAYRAAATDLSSSTTSSTTYADLAGGAGPTVAGVWMYAGQTAWVYTQSRLTISAGGAGHSARMSFAVSGADTVAAVDDDCAETLDTISFTQGSLRPYVATTTGLHTFAHKYRSTNGADTLTATRRTLLVEL